MSFKIRNIRHAYLYIIITLASPIYGIAQLLDVSEDVNLITDHTGGYPGSGVSFVDFNQDGYDDLTFGHHGGKIKFYAGQVYTSHYLSHRY